VRYELQWPIRRVVHSQPGHLVAAVLDQDPAVHGGKRVVFLASDDDGAAEEIGALAENLGFAPIKLGGLSEADCLCRRAEIAGAG